MQTYVGVKASALATNRIAQYVKRRRVATIKPPAMNLKNAAIN